MAVTSTLADGGYNPANFPRLIPKMSLLETIGVTIVKFITLPYSILLANCAVFEPGKRNEIWP